MKKLICTMAMAALLCGAAGAAQGSYTVTAELSPDVRVVIDGTERIFYNVQGQEVHPISYAGTTYVPIRSIGELMDKNVNWDESTSTATIGGARVTPDATGTPDKNAVTQDITLRIANVGAKNMLNIVDEHGSREEYYPDFMSRWHEAFVAEMVAFTGHVRENTKPADLTVYDGTAVSEAAYRCKESFETGKMLPIR